MAVYIRPFKKEDLDAFEPIERGLLRSDTEFAQAIEDSGLAVTGIREGVIWGCGGVHPTEDEGIGEIWLRLSEDCKKHKLDTIRWLRDGMKVIEESYPFRQINATIRCGFAQSVKLIEFLGFVQTQSSPEWNIYSKRIK